MNKFMYMKLGEQIEEIIKEEYKNKRIPTLSTIFRRYNEMCKEVEDEFRKKYKKELNRKEHDDEFLMDSICIYLWMFASNRDVMEFKIASMELVMEQNRGRLHNDWEKIYVQKPYLRPKKIEDE